ncbi:MAG TPA: DegQ family serine endoprotease [Chitinivibrionales bacterium]|nr:DegQ family serine endoprotease [Chitinivibrionales bacterium]
MAPFIKRTLPITMFLLLAFSLFVAECKFSFADSGKRPDKGSITFGAKEKPEVKTTPDFQSFKTIFADIADKVIPSVVSVIPTQIDTVVFNNNPFYQFFGDEDPGFPFDQFFNVPRGHGNQKRQPQQQPKKQFRRQQGLGSGVIVSKDGYILTNYHVVHGADEIEVRTADKRTFQASIVGVDSLSDVAVIKIKGEAKDLTVAYIGDSDKLRVGEWVMAVGNPFALTSTVTQGIVSALGRRDDKNPTQYQNYIQTDAAINPGNSGGALVNLDGELIGINTMIYTTSGGFMGIGMAIPINMARRVMEDIIYNGKVTRGWLGVQIQDINDAMRSALGLGNRKGVLIGDVFKGQPADRAGIKRGDVVLSVDGKAVETSNELKNTVAGIQPGKKIPVVVFRGGKEITVNVVLNERDEAAVNKLSSGGEKQPEGGADTGSQLGLSVTNLTEETRQQFSIASDVTGVVVTDVDQASQAAGEGVQPGDVVQEINRQPVSSVKEFTKVAKSIKPGTSVLLLIRRGQNSMFVAFTLRGK